VISHEAAWRAHQQAALQRLRELTFRSTGGGLPPRLRDSRADGADKTGTVATLVFDSADGLTIGIKTRRPTTLEGRLYTLAFAVQPTAISTFAGGGSSRPTLLDDIATAAVEVRNTGITSVGPGYLNTLRRTYPLLGQTLAERQVADLRAAIALLRQQPLTGRIATYGQGYTAPLAVYAALLDPDIAEVVLADPPASHEDPQTAEFLGVLRIGDLPHNLALLYPRPITFVGKIPPAYEWTRDLYRQLGAGDRVRVIGHTRDWRPAPAGP
jgi:hypothetical protein